MRMLRVVAVVVLLASACTPPAGGSDSEATVPPVSPSPSSAPAVAAESWVYQLQGYPDGRLDELVQTTQGVAVIDLARDAHTDFFRPDEITALRGAGKTVLAYFEIGSIEEFRPEYPLLRAEHPDLILNRWPDWPDEHFVAYWEPRWWELVVQPRIDQALRAGFDGVYLDTPLAYEELDLSLAPGRTREDLAIEMVDLIVRISQYAKAQNPALKIVPQNSPELRHYTGYTEAIDGIGMEELFVRATDDPCVEEYCAENLANARALRDAGKFVLAVDYAERDELVSSTCARYRAERFTGYIGVRELDGAGAACP
jgi:cysteinyl-tRNA synthetase